MENILSNDGLLADTLDERDWLLSMVSHELRNPLGAITFAADALTRHSREGMQATMASTILRSARRMERLIRDVLDTSRAGLRRTVDLKLAHANAHEICSRVIDELRLAHPRCDISFTAEGDGGGYWDQDRLEQVVSNLVGNAIHHGHTGTPILVRSQARDLQHVISVQNRGEIIAPELLPHLFEPFSRGTSRGSAKSRHLGLGLFIVHQLVTAHGGTIEVTSDEKSGTRFAVTLQKLEQA
jgi:phosphoserine phosphatase RsbU/P